MKKQKLSEKDELQLLSEQVSPEEMYVLGFLKSFDRRNLKEWGKKGLLDFSMPTIQ